MGGPHQESPALQALAVILQHPAVAACQRNICTMLQVCKSWRAAVQNSEASMTHISINIGISSDDDILHSELPKVSNLAGWLAKHPGLICDLLIGLQDPDSVYDQGMAAPLHVARQLIELGLKAAAAAGSGSGASLRLQSCEGPFPASTGLLAALPAATLTRLESGMDSSNCFSILSGLSNLKNLRLRMVEIPTEATDMCLSEIGKLQQLTQLVLSEVSQADMRVLPTQLHRLELVYRSSSSEVGMVFDLQHLQYLRQLKLDAHQLAAGCVLPVHLHSLDISAAWQADRIANMSSLQQLTSVRLGNPIFQVEHVRILEQLSQLQDVSLSLQVSEHLLEAAAAWQNIPLRSLHIFDHTAAASELQQVVQHVGAASRLTDLTIRISNITSDEQPVELAVCQPLTGLRSLNALSLSIDSASCLAFAAQDAQQLSTLTALTSLDLSRGGSGPYVDAATVCLLALSLTGLKALYVNAAEEDHDQQYYTGLLPVLPVIGRLTSLEVLALEPLSSEDAQRGLEFLTGLHRLNSLEGFHAAGEEALQAFWDTMGGVINM